MKPTFAIKDRVDGYVIVVYEGDAAEERANAHVTQLNLLYSTGDYVVVPWASGSTND
jgi:hypothetical protein